MDRDSGASPIIGQMLMVALVVLLAAIIIAFVTGLVSRPLQDTKLTPFQVEPGYDGLRSGTTIHDATYLTLVQMAGDDLNAWIDATKVTLRSPSDLQIVVESAAMVGDPIEKGTVYYIYKLHTGSASDPDDYYLTDNPDSIFSSSGIEPFESGTWEIIISDIADTKTVIYQAEVVVT